MKPSVYVETTVISYLVGWLNRNDLQVAAHQEITRRWWETRRHDFSLFASSLVLDEAGDGDPLLAVSDQAYALRSELLQRTQIPTKAENDALHIAIATVHGMELLITWNCKHIANAVTLPRIYDVCRAVGYEPPLVCTPYELLGGEPGE